MRKTNEANATPAALGGSGPLQCVARESANGDVIFGSLPWQDWHAPSWEKIVAAEATEKTETKQP